MFTHVFKVNKRALFPNSPPPSRICLLRPLFLTKLWVREWDVYHYKYLLYNKILTRINFNIWIHL